MKKKSGIMKSGLDAMPLFFLDSLCDLVSVNIVLELWLRKKMFRLHDFRLNLNYLVRNVENHILGEKSHAY